MDPVGDRYVKQEGRHHDRIPPPEFSRNMAGGFISSSQVCWPESLSRPIKARDAIYVLQVNVHYATCEVWDDAGIMVRDFCDIGLAEVNSLFGSYVKRQSHRQSARRDKCARRRSSLLL